MTTPVQPMDEIDRLFAGYLKAQVPHPWPACQALHSIEPAERNPAGRPAGRHSRLTLAVSFTFLLGLGLTLANGPRTPSGTDDPRPEAPAFLRSATADGKALKPAIPPTTKKSDE